MGWGLGSELCGKELVYAPTCIIPLPKIGLDVTSEGDGVAQAHPRGFWRAVSCAQPTQVPQQLLLTNLVT